jgi:hypothetical protein
MFLIIAALLQAGSAQAVAPGNLHLVPEGLRLQPWALAGSRDALSSGSGPPFGSPAVDVQRLTFIDDRLLAERPQELAWWVTWVSSLSAVAVGQAVAAWQLQGTRYDEVRPQLGVGAASAAIGAAAILILMPSPGVWKPDGGGLESAERRLNRIADAETLGTSWLAQLAATAVNAAGAVVLAAGFHQPGAAVLSFAVGMSVAEAQIATHPTAGRQTAADYAAWPMP